MGWVRTWWKIRSAGLGRAFARPVPAGARTPQAEWTRRHQDLATYLQHAENPAWKRQAQSSLSLIAGEIVEACIAETWTVLKSQKFRTAWPKLRDINLLWHDQVDERLGDSPALWAHKMVDLSLSASLSDHPIARYCEPIVDRLIVTALERHPEVRAG